MSFANITTVSAVRTIGRIGYHGAREIMGKTVDPKHYAALKKFMDKLSQDQTRALADMGASDKDAIGVYNDTGRKFDKILVSRFHADERPTKPEVRFFVDRDSGEIYGPKSDLAPNPKRYFGTIYDAHLWDWSNDVPQPIDMEKAGVKSVRTYGDVVHYEKVG